MSAADDLADILKPLCPAKWEWVTDERTVTNPDVVTCVLTPNTLEPEPSGGKWNLRVTWQLTIIQPGSDATVVETPLADSVMRLLIAYRGIDRQANPKAKGVAWDKAVKALWQNTNLCWQITLYSITDNIAS